MEKVKRTKEEESEKSRQIWKLIAERDKAKKEERMPWGIGVGSKCGA